MLSGVTSDTVRSGRTLQSIIWTHEPENSNVVSLLHIPLSRCNWIRVQTGRMRKSKKIALKRGQVIESPPDFPSMQIRTLIDHCRKSLWVISSIYVRYFLISWFLDVFNITKILLGQAIVPCSSLKLRQQILVKDGENWQIVINIVLELSRKTVIY